MLFVSALYYVVKIKAGKIKLQSTPNNSVFYNQGLKWDVTGGEALRSGVARGKQLLTKYIT